VTELTFNLTEITIVTGRTKNFSLNLDDKQVNVPVSEDLFAHLHNQFLSKKTTTPQKQRYAAMLNLVRAAYDKKGLEDGRSRPSKPQK
jgi:hypothetical protein